MQDSVSSPASPASPATSALRPLDAALASAAGLVAVRHPGVRPPQDVRQTCALLFAVAPVYVLSAYLTWDRLDSGVPDGFVAGLWALLAVTVLVAAFLAAVAVPVRRGAPALWRSAQAASVVGLGAALAALYCAARLASTPLLVAGLLTALAAVVVCIALWSSEVRRWCS
ncbi:hypothetical protein ACFWTE_22675 [Nocardiopsis sp. NPDC058631]|uniref:hypothetical protein n=1 Tax=Nocardiopsis sp. NPDC058631 TaxID=3346566 RepID=UPI00364919A3